jgi:hypothetical protein
MFVVSEKAKAKLLEVGRQILEEPRKFDMLIFGADATCFYPFRRPPCNTVACIAGWIVLNEHPDMPVDNITATMAIATLGYDAYNWTIPYREFSRLFHLYDWPLTFSMRYKDSPANVADLQANAEVVNDVINHFHRT